MTVLEHFILMIRAIADSECRCTGALKEQTFRIEDHAVLVKVDDLRDQAAVVPPEHVGERSEWNIRRRTQVLKTPSECERRCSLGTWQTGGWRSIRSKPLASGIENFHCHQMTFLRIVPVGVVRIQEAVILACIPVAAIRGRTVIVRDQEQIVFSSDGEWSKRNRDNIGAAHSV